VFCIDLGTNSKFCPEQTLSFAVHNIKRLRFITKVESVYSAVRTESVYNTDKFSL
jgi:hypothetical protein